MSALIDEFLEAETFTQLLTVAVLLWVGQWAVQRHPNLKNRGQTTALIAFAGNIVWSVTGARRSLADDPLTVIIHAGVLATFVLAFSWISFPAIAALNEVFVRSPLDFCRQSLRSGWKWWSDYRSHRRLLAEQSQSASTWEQTRHERERKELNRKEQESKRQTEANRREQIRFDVRLFYDRYRRELADVFPEEKFDAYFQSFLTDSTAPELFEQRAERLKDMIRDRLELSSRQQSAGFETIDAVIAHYDGKRQLISQLPVDDEVREDFLMQLDDSMERDLREFL